MKKKTSSKTPQVDTIKLPSPTKKKRNLEDQLIFWLFLLPVLFAFIMVVVIPFGLGIYYSFTNWSASAQKNIEFVGMIHYKNSLKDTRFIYSTIITSIYTILNVVAINVVAFGLALLVTSKIKLRNFYRVGFFLPNVIGGVILGYIWQFIFNQFIPGIGKSGLVEIMPSLKVLSEKLMLGEVNTSILAMVIVGTWQYAGYIMMIYVAAIQNIPGDLTEAAQVDGASPLQRLWHITLPMLASAFTITMFLTLVNSFKQYDVNMSLTKGGPSTMFQNKAIQGTQLLAMNIADTSQVYRNTAMAQSRAVMFFLVLVAISLLQVYFNKKREVEM